MRAQRPALEQAQQVPVRLAVPVAGLAASEP